MHGSSLELADYIAKVWVTEAGPYFNIITIYIFLGPGVPFPVANKHFGEKIRGDLLAKSLDPHPPGKVHLV